MPLTEGVQFKAVLQKGNRIQVPRLIRWQFKMEPTQILKVTVEDIDGRETSFYAKMNKDGRLTIPKLDLKVMEHEEEDHEDYILKVLLEPVERTS
jgi:bifunctional DNA-binding transcriptional regulator/antitoxin component of YhaV-PrlF toxin-antitoxin module